MFVALVDTIDLISNDKFYNEIQSLLRVKDKLKNWYEDFKINVTLINISIENLKFIDLEVTEFFAKYIETEVVSRNYAERISYSFSILKKFWKDEMEGNIIF